MPACADWRAATFPSDGPNPFYHRRGTDTEVDGRTSTAQATLQNRIKYPVSSIPIQSFWHRGRPPYPASTLNHNKVNNDSIYSEATLERFPINLVHNR